MNDKVKFERRSGIWNVRFPDGKNRSYKNQDLAEQAINTFLAQNPKYTAVMGDVKSSTKSSPKSKTVQKVAQNEPQSQMLDDVVVTAKHLHPEKLDQEGTVVTESKFASEDPFVQDAAIQSDLKQSMREGQNWIDRQQGRNYNQNFENAYYSMGNDWFLHPQDYIYPGYFNSDFHKNYREGSDLAGKIIAGYASSLWGLGKVFELPSTIGEIWQGAKGLYNAYKLNPLFGAYQTFKVAAPTAVRMAAGYGGYKGTDWVSRQLTGKTYGENFSEGTGLPIWFGDLTNPGGYIPISYGVKLWNGAERLVTKGYNKFINPFFKRFTSDGWFTIGNKQYRPSMSTLSVGFPVVESRPAWKLEPRPSIITTAERMGIPKSERHLRTHGHDYSNPSSYGKLYQNGSVNPESNQFGKFIDEGSEASVFDDPTNPHMVLKVNTDWKGPLQEFYTNYVLKRNRVPNQKPIILRGITEEGFPVFNQEKVTPMTDDQYFQNLPKIREMLHNKGFIGDPEDLGYMSNGVMKIGDFNPGNVAFDSKGNIVFIDIDAYKRGGKINEKC